MRFLPIICLSLLSLALPFALATSAGQRETGFIDRTLSLHGAEYNYQVYLPDNWTPKQRWPVILFLHGYGERGSDGLLQTDVGLPHAVRLARAHFPAIIVMPQCRGDRWWTEKDMEEMALATLTAATKDFKGDPKRTYLTGLSMGGYATWDIASRYPGRFAAVVPICGGVILRPELQKSFPSLAKDAYPDDPKTYDLVAKKLGKTPIWIFHGGADETVPVEYSRKMNEALKAAGGDVRYTEYADVGHNSWDKAYSEPELMSWMLSKSI